MSDQLLELQRQLAEIKVRPDVQTQPEEKPAIASASASPSPTLPPAQINQCASVQALISPECEFVFHKGALWLWHPDHNQALLAGDDEASMLVAIEIAKNRGVDCSPLLSQVAYLPASVSQKIASVSEAQSKTEKSKSTLNDIYEIIGSIDIAIGKRSVPLREIGTVIAEMQAEIDQLKRLSTLQPPTTRPASQRATVPDFPPRPSSVPRPQESSAPLPRVVFTGKRM